MCSIFCVKLNKYAKVNEIIFQSDLGGLSMLGHLLRLGMKGGKVKINKKSMSMDVAPVSNSSGLLLET